MRNVWYRLALVFSFLFILSNCTKPKLYGTIQPNEPEAKYYNVSPEEAFRAVKESLIYHGYSLKDVDDKEYTLETYWQPTAADSHYVDVFGRRDYGTVGAYYRIAAKITPRNSGAEVQITNVAKSFITNLKSSGRQEDSIFEKVDDFTRKKDIEVTNIGLQ